MVQNPRQIDFSTLIPELRLWNDGQGIDVDSWLACVGSLEHAVAYGNLFWPQFTVHDDCVLFADFSEESYLGFMGSTGGHKESVEIVMNHRHIVDIFPNGVEDPSENLILYLGRLLKEIWECKLGRDYPNRNIVVSFPEDGIEDLVDYEVTFYQERGGG